MLAALAWILLTELSPMQGWDKTYCLQFVEADGFNDIHFFGDKTFEVGTTLHPRHSQLPSKRFQQLCDLLDHSLLNMPHQMSVYGSSRCATCRAATTTRSSCLRRQRATQ